MSKSRGIFIVSGLFLNLTPTCTFHCHTRNCGGPSHASLDTSYPTDCPNSETSTIKTIVEHWTCTMSATFCFGSATLQISAPKFHILIRHLPSASLLLWSLDVLPSQILPRFCSACTLMSTHKSQYDFKSAMHSVPGYNHEPSILRLLPPLVSL
jgi:hypothetical protein